MGVDSVTLRRVLAGMVISLVVGTGGLDGVTADDGTEGVAAIEGAVAADGDSTTGAGVALPLAGVVAAVDRSIAGAAAAGAAAGVGATDELLPVAAGVVPGEHAPVSAAVNVSVAENVARDIGVWLLR